MKSLNFILIAYFLSLFTLKASELSKDWSYFKQDYKQLFENISKIKLVDAAIPLTATGIILTSSYLDDYTRNFVRDFDDENLYNYLTFTNQLGEPYFFATFPGLIYAAGYLTNSADLRRTGRLTYESILISGVTAGVIKYVVGRARPYNELGNSIFELFSFNDDFMSFPSGHTTMVFAMATVFAYRSRNALASVLYFGLASSTGLSRIYFDKHWISDVLAGAFLGTLTSLAIINAENDRIEKSKDNENFVPIIVFKINL